LVFPADIKLAPIKNVVPFAIKAGLIETEEEIGGVVFKGVGDSFDTLAFKQYLKTGRFIKFKKDGYTTEIVISSYEANKMNVSVGSEVRMYFFQDPPRQRKLTVVGIYETGMEDFDRQIILGDIGLARRLNNWDKEYAGGYEVYLKDVNAIDEVQQQMYAQYGYDLYVQKTSNKFLQVFEWLSLIDNNVNILLFMVLFVASFNMISIILILILERTPMIGTLKALGATNGLIRKIFVYNGMQMIIKGMIIGNVVGVGLAAFQWYFKFIKLDPSNYYMSFVPIEFNVWVLFSLNLLVLSLVSAILILPTVFVARIEPIKAIKFD
jgi:lipoprotein-releasing system permease protein